MHPNPLLLCSTTITAPTCLLRETRASIICLPPVTGFSVACSLSLEDALCLSSIVTFLVFFTLDHVLPPQAHLSIRTAHALRSTPGV